MASTEEFLIATEPLYLGRFRAANPGDQVPKTTVEANGWDGKVARPNTKAAERAADQQA